MVRFQTMNHYNGSNNTAVGSRAGVFLNNGSNNIFIGSLCAYNMTGGSNNTIIGCYSGPSSVIDNTVMLCDGTGGIRFCSNPSGAVSFQGTGNNGSTGQFLVSNGPVAYPTWSTNFGGINSKSPYSTSIGYNTLSSISTGLRNTAFGYNASDNLTTATDTTNIGYLAGSSGTSENYSTCVGSFAGQNIRGGYGYNTCIGAFASSGSTGAGYTTAIGAEALVSANTLNNTAIGFRAGFGCTSGANNTFLGTQTAVSFMTGSNSTIIGYGASSSNYGGVDNEITLGNTSITTLRCQTTTITAISDMRDKTNIIELPIGLDFINELKPVEFVWNMRDGGKIGEKDIGFIAQDLQTAQTNINYTIPHLVYEVNPERLEAGQSTLIPVLVKAVQELSKQVNELKQKINF